MITRCKPNLIGQVLKENLPDMDTVFVFATDVAMNSWVDWCVKNPGESGVKAVALDRFTAWDKFKEKHFSVSVKGKHSVPSLLRKFFVYNLIALNAQSVKEGHPVFNCIINPVYADDAYSFADWISSILPSLKKWNDAFVLWQEKNPDALPDQEDLDYLELYRRYKEFLGDRMFEPSWEELNLSSENKKFILFYPEQLQDFDDYARMLETASNVQVYLLPENDLQRQEVYVYPDARMEIRRTALKIRELVETSGGKIKYEDISVHVPKLDVYKPYLKREFQNHSIPCVIRKGTGFTVNCAGNIFECINDCYTSNFSYDSVRALVLNKYVPWNDADVNERLIREGNRLHCLCNYEDGFRNDQWIKALGMVEDDLDLKDYYKKLRRNIEFFCTARTFAEIKDQWNIFKRDFLDKENFSAQADNVLSRCVATLDELIQLEESYVEEFKLQIKSPYTLFLNELRKKSYRAQEEISGVSVFEYKLAAGSACKYNFVLNCTQNAIDVTYRPVSFLNSIKRKQLDFKDNSQASGAFVELYGKFNSPTETVTWFSCATDGFEGFAIHHNYLKEANVPKGHTPFEELDQSDFILNQKKWMSSENPADADFDLSEEQKKRFENWAETSDFAENANGQEDSAEADSELVKKVMEVVAKNRSGKDDAKEGLTGIAWENEKARKDASIPKITQTDLAGFFPCPRKWLLKNVLHLKEDSLDLELVNPFDQGNILHKMLELVVQSYDVLPVSQDASFGEFQQDVENKVRQSFFDAIKHRSMEFKDSPLVQDVLESQQDKFQKVIMSFLYFYCDSSRFGGYRVVGTEKKYTAAYDSKYALQGTIDCLLSSGSGDSTGEVIVDYKTSAPPSAKSCCFNEETNRLDDFQCAEYVELYEKNVEGGSVEKMEFYKIKFSKKEDACRKVIGIPQGRSKSKTREEYNQTLEVFGEYVNEFYQKLSEGKFIPVSDLSSRYWDLEVNENCKRCSFKSMCRTSFVVSGHKL